MVLMGSEKIQLLGELKEDLRRPLNKTF